MSPLKETFLVFAHEMRRTLRSARTLVFLILYGLFTAAIGLGLVWATRSLQEQLNKVTHGEPVPPEALAQAKMGGLALFFGKDDVLLKSLSEIPIVVVLFAAVALFFLPVLSALVGFDSVSGELQNHSLRFVSLRARRGSLLAGKMLAQLALLVGLTALSVLFGFTVLWLMSKFETLSFIAWFLPSSYKDGLFSSEPMPILTSVAVYLGFAVIFCGLAYLTLRRRDL